MMGTGDSVDVALTAYHTKSTRDRYRKDFRSTTSAESETASILATLMLLRFRRTSAEEKLDGTMLIKHTAHKGTSSARRIRIFARTTTVASAALAIAIASASASACCAKKPPVVSVVRVPTSCLENIGPRPTMQSQPDTRPEGCPEDMACFDTPGMVVLGRFIRETLRWMEQVELACLEQGTP